MILLIEERQVHTYRKYTDGYQLGKEGGGINQEFRVSRYILQYTKKINNKDLLTVQGIIFNTL